MTKARTIATALLLLAGGGCAPLNGQEAHDQAIFAAQVKEACLYSPLFKQVNGIITLVVPEATIPVDIANAGLALVCTDPNLDAHVDALTADWVYKVIHDHQMLGG